MSNIILARMGEITLKGLNRGSLRFSSREISGTDSKNTASLEYIRARAESGLSRRKKTTLISRTTSQQER